MLVLAILSLARVTLKEVTSEKLWVFRSFQVLCPFLRASLDIPRIISSLQNNLFVVYNNIESHRIFPLEKWQISYLHLA